MIGKNLKYYRLMAGLSQEQLANKIGISKMTISNYEKNKREADSETIIKLADALKIKAINLLKNDTNNVLITHGEFKRKSVMNTTSEEILFETLDRKLRNYDNIISILGPNAFPKTILPKKILFKDIEDAGKQIRKYLSTAFIGPIGNITDIIENKGILISYIDIENNLFSGINGTVNNRPYIVINKNMSYLEQRFTLIHELAHLLFLFDKNINEEEIIDKIVESFFFTKDDVIRELGPSRTNIYGDLKPLMREYGIPAKTILNRAKQVGCISNSIYEKQYKYLKEHNTNDETSIYFKEQSVLFEQLVIRGVTEGIINENKASELLEMPYDKVWPLYIGE